MGGDSCWKLEPRIEGEQSGLRGSLCLGSSACNFKLHTSSKIHFEGTHHPLLIIPMNGPHARIARRERPKGANAPKTRRRRICLDGRSRHRRLRLDGQSYLGTTNNPAAPLTMYGDPGAEAMLVGVIV